MSVGFMPGPAPGDAGSGALIAMPLIDLTESPLNRTREKHRRKTQRIGMTLSKIF
jgi:hypothetical protein